MKNAFLTSYLIIIGLFVHAQTSIPFKKITNSIPPAPALAPLLFLASDELMGRGTTRPEINIAARYISETFRSFGLKEVPGTNDYFQTFDIKFKKAATNGGLTVNGNTYAITKELLEFIGDDVAITAPVVYATHGTGDDLNGIDVKGKIVITEPGSNDSASFRQGIAMLGTKRKLLQEKGAVAIVERFKTGGISWAGLQQHFTTEQVTQSEQAGIPVFIVNDETASLKNVPSAPGRRWTCSGLLGDELRTQRFYIRGVLL